MRRGWGQAAAAAGGAIGGALLFVIARHALPDDTYITLDYARSLAFHGTWGILPDLPSNTATSPLNVILLAVLTYVLRSPVMAVGILLATTTATTAAWLHSLARHCGLGQVAVPLLGVALLLANPLLAATVGLETYLAITLMIGLVRYAVAGRWIATGVLAGLLVLTRPDLALVDVAVVLLVGAVRRKALAAGLVAVAVAAPWHVFSWFSFGSATSDTLAAKSVAGGWGRYEYANGLLHYLQGWRVPTVLALVPAALGLIALLGWLAAAVRPGSRTRAPARTAALALAAAAVADFAGLASLGVAPFYWYYGPAIAGLSLTAVLGAAALRTAHRMSGGIALAVIAASVTASIGYDIGRGAPWEGFAPIRINWATPAEYRQIAEALPAGAVVESPGEIGTLAYYCDCAVVDYFSDPGRMRPYIERYRDQHPSVVWGVNYWHYDPPAPRPAQARIVYEWQPPDGPYQWPTHFPGDGTKRMRLESLPVPAPAPRQDPGTAPGHASRPAQSGR